MTNRSALIDLQKASLPMKAIAYVMRPKVA